MEPETIRIALWVAYGAFNLMIITAAAFDIWKYIIPNVIVLGLLVLFPVTALIYPFEVDWLSHLGAGLAVFAAGFALYALNWLGAGDVKLLMAVALWAGFADLPEFLLYVALAGGALAILLMLSRRIAMAILVSAKSGDVSKLPKILVAGEPLPYGVAVAFGALYLAPRLPLLDAEMFSTAF